MLRILSVVAVALLWACGSDRATAVGAGEEGGAAGESASEAGAPSTGDAGADSTMSANLPRVAVPACPAEANRCTRFTTERPFRLSEHESAYLEERKQMVVFGGSHEIPENCGFPASNYVRDTWIYDDPCGAWQQLDVDGPSPRGRHAMTAGAGVAWLFGGRWREPGSTTGDFTVYNDLWIFDPDTFLWQEVPTHNNPPPRANSAIAWDSARERLWLFGGTSVNGFEADLWSIDPISGGQWESHSSDNTPPARAYHSLLYDAERDRLILQGGGDQSFMGIAGIWALDLDTFEWKQLDEDADPVPDPRAWGRLVLDTLNDRYILFGGHDNTNLGNRNDLWFFDPQTLTWENGRQGDTFQTGPRDFCDFPPDFAKVDIESPERRNAHTFVWSTTCEHAILFAGKTDCGVTDDVWYYGEDAQGEERWMEAVPATEGETCARWRDDINDCTNVCN